MDFPASPAVNQLFSFAGKTWKCIEVGPPPMWELQCGTAASNLLTEITDPTTARTIQASDHNCFITFTNSAAITVTVPTNAAQAFPVGGTVHLFRQGTGQITCVASGGVTVEAATATLSPRVRYSTISLHKRATDIWVLFGDTA